MQFEFLCHISSNKNKAIVKLDELVNNFVNYYSKIFDFNRQISECVEIIFKQSSSPFSLDEKENEFYIDNSKVFDSISNDFIKANLESIKIFNEIIPQLSKLCERTSRFKNYYEDIDSLKKDKNEKFKTYDYYHKKLKKLQLYPNKNPEKLTRNEEKYLKAQTDYIHSSYKAYDSLNNLDIKLYNEVNFIIKEIVNIKHFVHENISSNFIKCKKYINEVNLLSSLEVDVRKFINYRNS